MKKISVIVPIYNVEKYLSKCLDSLVNQDYDNYEIVLVDDGSTDNSGDIAKMYSDKHSNIILLRKENGGLSDARNYGIENSESEFINFVDSDDYVDNNYLSTLAYLQKKYNSDISVVRRIKTYIKPSNTKIEKCYSQNEALIEMFYRKNFGICATAKLYRRSLFDDVRYPVGMNFEDVATTYKLFKKANCVSFSNDSTYYLSYRPTSITNLYNKKTVQDGFKVQDELLKEFENSDEDLKKAINYSICINTFEIMNLCINKDKQDYDESIRRLKKIYIELMNNQNVSKYIKIKLFVAMMGERPFNLLLNLINSRKKYDY